jgi:hypothetical protein
MTARGIWILGVVTAACAGGMGDGPAGTDPAPDGGGGNVDPGGCDDPATCVNECGPTVDVSSFMACSADGHCIPTSLIPADQQARFSTCTDGQSLCVPDVFVETAGQFILPTCTSISGLEGRCLSMTLPDIAAQRDRLPQDTCAATERCAPCYDPLSGSETGACSLSCDPGPASPPPAPAPKCCSMAGTCLPSELVPADQASHLDEDSCPAGQGYLCIPDELIAGTPPVMCEATIFGIPLGDGACESTCLPDVRNNAFFLSTDGCPPDHACAPCNDPFSGMPTGACP